jgi:hypothetical protein
VLAVLTLLFASLAAIGVAVIFLAAKMIAVTMSWSCSAPAAPQPGKSLSGWSGRPCLP